MKLKFNGVFFLFKKVALETELFWRKKNKIYICIRLKAVRSKKQARIAQLVEHDLAKVGVAGSSPVSRSRKALHQIHCNAFLRFNCISIIF